MDKETRGALCASIVHWEENWKADAPSDVDTGWRACPLCRMFFEKSSCFDCPVAKKTGQLQCGGTPYEGAFAAYRNWQEAFDEGSQIADALRLAFRKAARKEIDFLQSILDEANK